MTSAWPESAHHQATIEAQTILVTRATDGLGRAFSRELARLGATVLL